jgi:hypothetical protein
MEKKGGIILSVFLSFALTLISMFIVNTWIFKHNDNKDTQKEITTKIETLQLFKVDRSEVEVKIKDLDNKKQDKEVSNQQYISLINLLTPMSLDLQELKRIHLQALIPVKDTLRFKCLPSIPCKQVFDCLAFKRKQNNNCNPLLTNENN